MKQIKEDRVRRQNKFMGEWRVFFNFREKICLKVAE
jgi:hypothetical protein